MDSDPTLGPQLPAPSASSMASGGHAALWEHIGTQAGDIERFLGELRATEESLPLRAVALIESLMQHAATQRAAKRRHQDHFYHHHFSG